MPIKPTEVLLWPAGEIHVYMNVTSGSRVEDSPQLALFSSTSLGKFDSVLRKSNITFH